MDIVDQIVRARKQRSITQQKLAEMTGILQPVIARVEKKRSSPTIEFLSKILEALDLELSLTDSLDIPKGIFKIIKDLPREKISIGRSGDKVYLFGDKYLLKVSQDKEALRLEKEKTDWLNKQGFASKSLKYIEKPEKAYYLRTFLKGHTLIEKPYLDNPNRLIKILKKVISILRSLDEKDCPFESLDNKGKYFVHGDLCLPNIVVNDKDEILGFVDLSNMGKGDRLYDYSWLLWSFEYNLKTNQYSKLLLEELNIEISPSDYLAYVLAK